MNPVRHRVLIVDDHAAIRRGLHDLIESSGNYEIVGQASNGHTALELPRKIGRTS